MVDIEGWDRQGDSPGASRFSRRVLLRRGTVLGVGLTASGALFAACGGSSSPPTATTAASSGASTAVPTTAPAATTTGGSTAGGAASPAASPPAKAAAAATQLAGQPGGTLKYAILREATTFDPQINDGATSTTIQGNIYDQLINYDVDGQLTPELAEAWDAAPDGKSYTFKLLKGVKFHSGDPFTAQDVVATFDRIRDEKTNATLRPQFGNVEGYTAPDDSSVTVTMKQPYATFLAVIAQREASIVSKKWTEAGHDYSKEANGTGPFKLDSFEAKVRYTLAKNPDYRVKGLPYLDKVEQTPIRDDTARVNAFKSGQVQFMSYVPWQNMKEFESNSNYQQFKGFDVFNLVRFNPKRAPLDNPLVRQALNYAVDRQAMIDLAFGGQGQAISVALIAQDSPWYNKDLDGHWKYDPDKAKQLLAQAGISDPSQVSLTFRSSSSAVHFDTAQIITQQLQKVGFKVTLEPQDSPTLLERRGTGDYQLMMDGLNLPYSDPDFYTAYFSSNGTAHAKAVGYSDPDLDKLLDQGRTTLDQPKRKEIYKQAEQRLLANPPWIFLYWRPQAEVMVKNLEGYARIKSMGSISEGFMERLWFKK